MNAMKTTLLLGLLSGLLIIGGGVLAGERGLVYGLVLAVATNFSSYFFSEKMAGLAGVDFFTIEVLTWRALATYYVLFFLHLESRRVSLGGVTRHPTEAWMQQVARNAMDDGAGTLRQHRYVLHDRDAKFCALFRA